MIGITMANVGNIPIEVVASGFKLYPESEHMALTITDIRLPKRLEQGQSHTSYLKPEEVEADKLMYAWVRDATGKEYFSKKWPLKRK
jgi:hypothetical protein